MLSLGTHGASSKSSKERKGSELVLGSAKPPISLASGTPRWGKPVWHSDACSVTLFWSSSGEQVRGYFLLPTCWEWLLRGQE